MIRTGLVAAVLGTLLLQSACQVDDNQSPDLPPIEPLTPVIINNAALKPRPLQSAVVPWTHSGALAVHGDEVFVLDRAGGNLVVADAELTAIKRTISVGERPHHLTIGPDGAAWVVVRNTGHLVKIGPGGGAIEDRAKVGIGATSLALSPEADVVFVSSTALGKLLAFSADSLEVLASVDLQKPRAVVAKANGALTVTSEMPWVYHLSFSREDGALTLKSYEDLRNQNPDRPHDHSTSNATAALGAAPHPETGQVMVAHQLSNPGTIPEEDERPEPSRGGYGSANPESPSVPQTPIVITTSTVGEPGEDTDEPPSAPPVTAGVLKRANMPVDIDHHTTLTMSMVTCNGSDNVLFLGSQFKDPTSAALGTVGTGEGPEASAVDPSGRWLYVLQGYGFELTRIDLSPVLTSVTGPDTRIIIPFDLPYEGAQNSLSIGVDPLTDTQKLGRRIFSFSQFPGLSHEGQLACQNCHPEGREDGLVWIVPEGLRQTPILAGRLEGTAPFNWFGSERSIQDNVIQTVERMGGDSLDEQHRDALREYLFSGMITEPNPHIDPNGLTEAQTRGQTLFNDDTVGCVNCHNGPNFTNSQRYDVGTISRTERRLVNSEEFDIDGGLDTPSLVGLYRSAPYLHDGSAPTLLDVLDKTATTMGYTEHLTLEEKLDLVAYLLTL